MPAYSATSQVLSLWPGDEITLFSAETLTAPSASIRFNLPPNPGGGQAQLSFQTTFTVAPTAVLTPQFADVDADANYVNSSTASTNKLNDRLDISTSAAFGRMNLTSQSAGGAVSVVVRRAA